MLNNVHFIIKCVLNKVYTIIPIVSIPFQFHGITSIFVQLLHAINLILNCS